MKRARQLLLPCALLLAGCGSDSAADPGGVDISTPADAADTAMVAPEPDTVEAAPDVPAAADTPDVPKVQTWPPAPEALGGDRPARYVLPADYDPAQAWPLVMLLHGYGANLVAGNSGGLVQDTYLGISAQCTALGFIAVVPDGTPDSQDRAFWNATDACCNFEGAPVDDVAYLIGLLDEAATFFHVDPKRVTLLGHSNGGFMSYRLACEEGERFAALASLAGATWKDDSKCDSTAPVSVLQIHGTNDETIAYEGSPNFQSGGAYPSAEQTVALWVARNGCEPDPADGAPLDLDSGLPGAETATRAWSGCTDGNDVELWTIEGGKHVPAVSPDFAPTVLGWLLGHSRP